MHTRLFTDELTIFHKVTVEGATTWQTTVVDGQYSEKTLKENNNGRIQVVKYIEVTIPNPSAEVVGILNAHTESDFILLGAKANIQVLDISGSRPSDILRANRGGLIKDVNDNTNRSYLKHIKAVLD